MQARGSTVSRSLSDGRGGSADELDGEDGRERGLCAERGWDGRERKKRRNRRREIDR